MFFSIFTPTSKVHAQRNIMRETDERVAIYSRRGILLNVVIYALCLFVGEFYQRSPQWAIVLSVGLIAVTFFRGYYLFRFEELYAQGPARWRNCFFVSTLTGAVWWGIILASVTHLNQGLNNEAPIFWLYTAAFFAGSIYVFAPFERFLAVYMFVAFIPCAVVAIYIFEPLSVLYGLIMITLYMLLCRQGGVIGRNYWDKLQATYEIMLRANALEAAKINTETSLNSRDTLFNNLTHELKSSMQEVQGSLQLLKYSDLQNEEQQLVSLSEQKTQQQINMLKNVAELSNVRAKSVVFDSHVIDPRHHIEQALSQVSVIAHKKNIELYSSFATDFPLRVRGDVERLEQLIGNLVRSACDFCDTGELLVRSSFRFEEEPGVLKISIVNPSPSRTPEAIESVAEAFSPEHAKNIHIGLSLAIVKGLAQCMGGDAGAGYRDDGSLIFWASIRLDSVSSNTDAPQPLLKLSGKKIMLYQPPSIIADVFQNTLESWGLVVETAFDKHDALQKLETSLEQEQPHQLIIIYTRLEDLCALELSKKAAKHEKLWNVPQIVILSEIQKKDPEVEAHFSTYVNVEVLYKPVRQRRLQKMIKQFLLAPKNTEIEDGQEEFLNGKRILLFQQEDIDAAIVAAMLKKLGCEVVTTMTIDESTAALSATPFDAFISESHISGVDLQEYIEEVRKVNDKLHSGGYKIPVLGYTSRELDGEESHCLASGMEYYIDSPTNEEDLRAILRRFIGRAEHMCLKPVE